MASPTKGTKRAVCETLVDVSPEKAYDGFLEHVWWGHGGMYLPPSVVKKGDVETGEGAIRRMVGILDEEILDVKYGKEINYHIKSGPFPVSYHKGKVEFHQAGPGVTRIVWTADYTPLLFCGTFTSISVNGTFSLCLSHLKTKMAKSPPSSLLWTALKVFLLIYLLFMGSRAIRIPSESLPPGAEYMAVLDQHHEATSDLNKVLRPLRYLVIGGSGFTGSALVYDLFKRNVSGIRIMGRSLPPSIEYPYIHEGKVLKYPLPGVEYVAGDVTSLETLKKAMKDVDVVFHTAAHYGNFQRLGKGLATEKVNYQGMQNIVEAAKRSGVKQVVYTSSCDTTFRAFDAMNINETQPFVEHGFPEKRYADGKLAVGDHYARTKIKAERFLLENHGKGGLSTISIRPNGIYGPGENSNFPKAFNPGFIMGALTFYFDLKQKSDWTCVCSLAHAHILAAYKLATKPETVGGKAYFITDMNQVNTAAWDIFRPAFEAAGVKVIPLLPIPPRLLQASAYYMEELFHYVSVHTGMNLVPPITYKESLKATITDVHDNTAAVNDLGYQPVMSYEECIRHTGDELNRRYNP